ncbi:DJ-1/PfpI family protein [Lagierella sp.]|uniref:DJ-1/PfpI family protein n=1 Tax=Lagierella sp. TaxID=2849657 RepID=UPI00260302C0|nr:DJ-1/PfpI family protein [Lagierella sp.]
MKKKIALLVYPEFSLQEIGNTIALFRWYFESKTVVLSSSKDFVKSEEGVIIQPEKTLDEFDVNDYDCLILPGISDIRESLNDHKLIDFLRGLKKYPDFVIGAICGGPIFLSMAGLLDDKKFTNQLYVEMNERLPFIKDENIQYKPIVVDGNIVTAVADAYADFPIAIARLLGYECPDSAYKPCTDFDESEEKYKYHMDEEGIKIFEEVFKDFL